MKLKFKILILTLAIFLAFGKALPAKAFYLEVPSFFSQAVQSLKAGTSQAQEGGILAPPAGNTIFCNALNRQATVDECGTASGQQSGGTTIFCNALGRQTTMDECNTASGQQSGNTNIFCNVLGKQTTKDSCDAAQRAQGIGTNNQQQSPMNNNQQQNQPNQNNNQQQPMMNQPNQNMNQDKNQNNQNQNMMGPQNGGMGGGSIKNMQQGAKQMERQLKQLQTQIQKAEKSGIAIDPTVKDQATQAQTIIDCVKNAADETAVQACNSDGLPDLMQNLEEQRQTVIDAAQRLQQVKKDIKNVESNIKMFEKQITKAGDCVSSDIKSKIEILKTTVATVKNATTWQEVENAGLDNMGDVFSDLNDARDQIQACSNWTPTLKQVDKQLKSLDKQVIQSKKISDRLVAKGIDVSSAYAAFETGVQKMHTTRDEAVAKVQSGDAQGALELVQDEIFGQMDDVMQNQQTIQMMSSLGSFNSQFKTGLSDAQKQINSLKKQKLDTTELVSVLAETKTKGTEILALIKQKDVDPDTIMSSMQDLQDLRTEFGDKVAELTGDSGGATMMVNQPQQQFNQLQMPSNMNQYMQPQQSQGMQINNNMNGGGQQPMNQ